MACHSHNHVQYITQSSTPLHSLSQRHVLTHLSCIVLFKPSLFGSHASVQSVHAFLALMLLLMRRPMVCRFDVPPELLAHLLLPLLQLLLCQFDLLPELLALPCISEMLES